MSGRDLVGRILELQRLNFLLTNRIPRRRLTQFMGWFSKLRGPWISVPSIAIWKFFADVDLSDSHATHFQSLHDCFIRELRPGARPIDPDPALLVSPCDALLGARGTVIDGMVLQAKGSSYSLAGLLEDAALAKAYDGGSYVTLRLTAGMYHRFHAPFDCTVEQVTYVPGDAWNVNPAALARIDQLYCLNERAVLRCRLPSKELITLVPVAAILVASLKLHCLKEARPLRARGPRTELCAAVYAKGEELGWFEHGSTIIVLAPAGITLLDGFRDGERVRMGQPLLRWQSGSSS
jgi:phosphatidylserine decarboxylase